MLDVASIFSSKARFKVIRTLYHQTTPLCLRHIAYLSEIPLFSVQRVLKQLVDEKMLIRKRKGGQVVFSANRKNPFDAFLTQLFDLEMKTQIASASGGFQERAKSVLHFSHAALGIIKGAKSWTLKNSSQKS
jgi:hypothetical protein